MCSQDSLQYPNHFNSGLVRAVSGAQQEKADSQPGIQEGTHAASRPNDYMYFYPGSLVPHREGAGLVRNSLIWVVGVLLTHLCQVYSTPCESREVQHQELGKHGVVPRVLFRIHIHRRSPKRRQTLPTTDDPELYVYRNPNPTAIYLSIYPKLTTHLSPSPDPFMTTIVFALAIVTYMVFAPAHWLRKVMQLTRISTSFKTTLLALGLAYLVLAWIGEGYVFQPLARAIGKAKHALTKTTKQRKEYKVIHERMQQEVI